MIQCYFRLFEVKGGTRFQRLGISPIYHISQCRKGGFFDLQVSNVYTNGGPYLMFLFQPNQGRTGSATLKGKHVIY